MYVYTIQFIPKHYLQKNNYFFSLYENKFPQEHIKLFISDNEPEIVKKEHEMIYRNYNIRIKIFQNINLINKFNIVKKIFNSYKNSNIIFNFNDPSKLQVSFNNIIDILKLSSSTDIDDNYHEEISIYDKFLSFLKKIEDKTKHWITFMSDSHNIDFNPCSYDLINFKKTEDYKDLCLLFRKEESFSILYNKLTYSVNSNWKIDLHNLKKNIEIQKTINIENKNLEYFSIEEDEDNNYIDNNVYSNDYLYCNNDFVVFKETYTDNIFLEYDKDRIKILEKSYFSEFIPFMKIIIPPDNPPYIMNELKKINKEKLKIYLIENIIRRINLINNVKVKIINKQKIIEDKKEKILNIFIEKYIEKSEGEMISFNCFFSFFIDFLDKFYPDMSHYYNKKNFTYYMKKNKIETKRKNKGIYYVDIKLT